MSIISLGSGSIRFWVLEITVFKSQGVGRFCWLKSTTYFVLILLVQKKILTLSLYFLRFLSLTVPDGGLGKGRIDLLYNVESLTRRRFRRYESSELKKTKSHCSLTVEVTNVSLK